MGRVYSGHTASMLGPVLWSSTSMPAVMGKKVFPNHRSPGSVEDEDWAGYILGIVPAYWSVPA